MPNTERKNFTAGGMLLRIFVCFMLLAVAVGGYFIYDAFLLKEDAAPVQVYIFRGEKKLKALSDELIFSVSGKPLIDIETLSEYCEYGIAGDGLHKTIVFENGGYADFSAGSAADINGEKHFLDDDAVLSGGKLFVPLSFFENNVSGLRVTRNDDGTKIYIDVAVSSYFIEKEELTAESALSVNDYFDAVGTGKNKPTFKSDLSAYEEFMNPSDRDKYLILINYENKLDKDYAPEKLTDLIHTRKDGRAVQQMDLYAAKAMEAMLKEAAANGYTSLSVTSAYRSYAYQQVLFRNQVNALRGTYGDAAETKAAEAVAIPGTSEHQSGLCADLHNLPAASQAFANEEEYTWLIENCAKFGYILRFPKNKTEITRIMFEPWHYRYVGRYHAERIMQEGLCLEEYINLLGQDYFDKTE